MPCMPPPCLRYGPPPPPPGPPGPPNEDEGAAVDRERPLATYDAAASLESSVWKKKETWLMTDHAKSARVVSIPRDHTDWRACRSPPRATYPTRALLPGPGDAISQEEWRGTRTGKQMPNPNPNPNTLGLADLILGWIKKRGSGTPVHRSGWVFFELFLSLFLLGSVTPLDRATP